jgi:hypothetical protein
MKFIVSLLLFFAVQLTCFAQQFPSELWHSGQVTLLDQSVRKGELKYDLKSQTVQVRKEEKTETYNASQIQVFFFIQASINARRTFYSLPYATNTGYARPTFFEVFVEGEMTLFGREYEVVSNIDSNPNRFNRFGRFNSPFNNPFANGAQTKFLAFKIYFADSKGRIRESSNRKRDILSYFDDKQSELKKYIKKEGLKLDDLGDVAKLVRYYNNQLS